MMTIPTPTAIATPIMIFPVMGSMFLASRRTVLGGVVLTKFLSVMKSADGMRGLFVKGCFGIA